MIHWLGSSNRSKAAETDSGRQERFKAERRLYRASSHLGIVTVQGHTRRPLFESLTNRDSVRYYNTGLVEPCLFSTGRVVGGKDRDSRVLRMLEIGDGRITSVRWSKGKREKKGASYRRSETRSTTVSSLFDRVALFAPGQVEEGPGEGQT